MTRDFPRIFREIPALLRSELPADLRAFRWQATSWMAKAWFGNRALHYEIWVRPKVVELGLHFESDELTNARLYGAFRARSKEIARALGKDARIEEWDKGWSRVWEPLARADIDEQLLRTRFLDYVRTLEPMLREELPSDVEWKIATPRAPRRAAPRAPQRTAPHLARKPARSARGSSPRASRSAR